MFKIFKFFILLIYIKSDIFLCQSCERSESLLNTKCFNNILYINENFRAGYLAKNKNGDIMAEFSSSNRRLFYGIKNSGKFYYDNIPYTQENSVNNENFFGRYESRNKFISLKDDSNKTKEYLLSISSYKTLIEIYDIENNALYEYVTEVIFGEYIHSFQFKLFGLNKNKQNFYFCIFSTPSGHSKIEKFYFNKQDNDESVVININNTISFNSSKSKVINAFLVDNNEDAYIYVIYINNNVCYIDKYNSILNQLSRTKMNQITISICYTGSWIYSSLYLQNNYAAIIYFNSQYALELKILELDSYNIISTDSMNFNCPGAETLFDFNKINNERVVFVSARREAMSLLFIDFYQNYEKIKSRLYLLNSDDHAFYKDLSLEGYNDFLILSVSVSKDKNIEQYSYQDGNCFSFFMIFGYPNGTDDEINISPYLFDSENYNSSLNLLIKFFENFNIDNNIFGYEKIERK